MASKNLLPEPYAKVITLSIMKSLFPCVLSILLLPLVSCIHTGSSNSDPLTFSTDQTVMLHWLEVDDNGVVYEAETDGNQTKQKDAFSGKAIETFEQSPTKSISSWKDGKRHGTTIEYFYNGRKRTSIVYKDGLRHGPSREFRITGELWREETYADDQLTGPKSEWHPNGVKSFQVEMSDGIAHGEAKEWYTDGTEKSSTIYRHGLREGPSSEWYPSGQQKLGLFYQKDKQHGLRTIWYENGKKRLSAQFVDDLMEGNSKGWFPNGQQQFDYNFKNNLEHGVCTEWNENGEKISEIRFDNGVPSQDLLTGQRIVTSPDPVESTIEQSSVPKKEDKTSLQNIDLPPVPENKTPIAESQLTEKPKQESAEANEVPSDLEVPNGEISPTEDSLPPPPSTPQQKIDSEVPAPPTPPAENPPSFDPFGDSPLDELDAPSELEPAEPSTSSSPFDDSPIGNEPFNSGPNAPFSDPNLPPAAPSFDPFAEPSSNEVPPPTAPDNPFEVPPPPAPGSPFEAPPPPPSFDPFDQPQNESSQNSPASEVPLGDVFGEPPPLVGEENQSPDVPKEPPLPPAFDPFDN